MHSNTACREAAAQQATLLRAEHVRAVERPATISAVEPKAAAASLSYLQRGDRKSRQPQLE